jgi:hypothetical protein
MKAILDEEAQREFSSERLDTLERKFLVRPGRGCAPKA